MAIKRNSRIGIFYGLLIYSLIFLSSCGGGGGGHSSLSTSSSSNSSASSQPVVQPDTTVQATQDCSKDSPYTLMITGGNRISSATLDTMVCTFFEVYPKTAALLNPNAPKTVSFAFKANLGFPAGASGDVITFDTNWMNSYPLDTDIVVHELTHVVQADLGKVAGWIVEGTADYVRDRYGLHNIENGWTIPIRYIPGQKYTDGYGTAAAFFKWVDAIYRQEMNPVVVEIYKSAATGLYDDKIWISLTGKDVDALWNEYKNHPIMPAFNTGVSVFLATDYRGREIKLERGTYDLSELLSFAVSDNEIASIKIPAGYKIKIYSGVNFSGEMLELTTDTPVLNENYVRNISSLVVE